MKTDIKSLLEFAGVDVTKGKARELVETMRQQPSVLDKDENEVNMRALNKLFSKEMKVSMDDVEKWEEADMDVIHIDDAMGNDTIYEVDGKFIFFDRHSGTAHVAPKGSTLISVFDTIRK